MDIISFNEAATANSRIEICNANPDSTSGLVSLPKVIEAGESITIPDGRVVVHPNLEIDGTLTIENGGELFVPFGGTLVSSDLMHPVDTINDLRNETGKYKYVYVSGYHIKDDGAFGSNMFVWDEDSTETDNGGTIIKCTTVTTGRYKLKYNGAVNVKWFGAKGDGATDDTGAFSDLENDVTGRTVDLTGKTYAVTSRPLKNTYTNGKFKYSGATRPAQESEGFTIPFGRFKNYCQQQENQKSYQCNPFEQFTGIVFIGDSITWGATLPENLSPGSDLSTLATRRDVFASPSFVNEFKRYIGREYFDNTAPTISNWPASTAGESTTEYVKNVLLYPNRNPFTSSAVGDAVITEEGYNSGFLVGYRMVLAAATGGSIDVVMPNFTGDKFTVVFTCVDSDSMYYEVLVDDVSIGTFGTGVAAGFVNKTLGNRINHTFDYVRNGTIKIRYANSNISPTRRLRIEAIEIPKTVCITNQGISGSNSTRYKTRALTTGHLPDIAVTLKDNYAFVQLGTNDRGPDSTWPNGLNVFEKQMGEIFDILDPLCAPIVMCANHVSAERQENKVFTMQQIRGALNKVANERNYDFIDNYAIFTWADPSITLADGLHPNALGHQMIYRNIVEALEQA